MTWTNIYWHPFLIYDWQNGEKWNGGSVIRPLFQCQQAYWLRLSHVEFPRLVRCFLIMFDLTHRCLSSGNTSGWKRQWALTVRHQDGGWRDCRYWDSCKPWPGMYALHSDIAQCLIGGAQCSHFRSQWRILRTLHGEIGKSTQRRRDER